MARAASLLRAGEVVAFPTETVYGLGADELNAAAVERIYAAKGRPAHNPIIVHVADVTAARPLVTAWPDAAARLAARFWPGPLTVVLPRAAVIPAIVTAGATTVAIRVPAHPVAQALLRAVGRPIAAPSANASGRVSPTCAEHVRLSLGGRIPMILDGGDCPGGIESTVVDLTAAPPRLLRPGLVSPAAIEAVIGRIERGPTQKYGEPGRIGGGSGRIAGGAARAEDATGAANGALGPHAPLPSPGLLSRHYAPRARVELIDGDGATRARTLSGAGIRTAHLRCGCETQAEANAAGRSEDSTAPGQSERAGHTPQVVMLPSEPGPYAAGLYAMLHRLDALGVDCIVVDLPPDTEAWLAVRDRLTRAAAPR